MYTHAREVISGLILGLIFTGLAGYLAWLDPWENGVPWVNWLVISVVAFLAVAAATALSEFTTDDGEFFMGMGVVLIVWGAVAGMLLGFATTMEPKLDPRYHTLAWSAYGVSMGIFVIAAMVQYLVGARAAHKANRSSGSHLSRVA